MYVIATIYTLIQAIAFNVIIPLHALVNLIK